MKKPTICPPLIIGIIIVLFYIFEGAFLNDSISWHYPEDMYMYVLRVCLGVFPTLCVLSTLVYSANFTKTKSSYISIGFTIAAILLSVLRALESFRTPLYYDDSLSWLVFKYSWLMINISVIIAIGFFIDNHKQNTLVVVSSIAYMICPFLWSAVKLWVDFTGISVSYEVFLWIDIIGKIIVPCWIFSACTIKQVSKTK